MKKNYKDQIIWIWKNEITKNLVDFDKSFTMVKMKTYKHFLNKPSSKEKITLDTLRGLYMIPSILYQGIKHHFWEVIEKSYNNSLTKKEYENFKKHSENFIKFLKIQKKVIKNSLKEL